MSLATPGGWALSGLALVHSVGRARLDVLPVAAGDEALEQLAARHGEAVAGLPGHGGDRMAARTVRGVPLLVRSYGWRPEGRDQLEQVAVYRVAGGVGYVGVVTGEETPSPAQIDDAAQVVSSLALETRTATRDYSTEELTALAELHGASSFPDVEHSFPDSSARLSARRGLTARGTLRPDGQGGFTLDPVDANLVTLALAPMAVVTVDHQDDAESVRRTLHVSPGASVIRSPVISGVHRLAPVPTARLGPLLVELVRLRERPPATGGGLSVSADAFRLLREAGHQGRLQEVETSEPAVERLRELLGSVVSSSHVRVRGDGEHAVHDGDVIWLDAGELGLWRVLPSPDRVALQPLDVAGLGQALDRLWLREPEASSVPS